MSENIKRSRIDSLKETYAFLLDIQMRKKRKREITKECWNMFDIGIEIRIIEIENEIYKEEKLLLQR